jgi:uncharacterized membrane protein YesL
MHFNVMVDRNLRKLSKKISLLLSYVTLLILISFIIIIIIIIMYNMSLKNRMDLTLSNKVSNCLTVYSISLTHLYCLIIVSGKDVLD